MNMIERMALAAWPDAERITDEMRSRMRAAIMAMREPTVAMIGNWHPEKKQSGYYKAIWQAMIDIALNE